MKHLRLLVLVTLLGGAIGSAACAIASADTPALADAGDGSAITLPAPTAAPAPATIQAPDASEVEHLWRGGQLVAAGIVGVYLLLGFLVKLDKRHAFYYAAGVTALGMGVEAIAAGRTPNIEMLMVMGTTLVAVLMRGPSHPPGGDA